MIDSKKVIKRAALSLTIAAGVCFQGCDINPRTQTNSLKETADGYLIPKDINLHKDFFRMGIPYCKRNFDYTDQDLYRTFNVLNKNNPNIQNTYTISLSKTTNMGVGEVSRACYHPH